MRNRSIDRLNRDIDNLRQPTPEPERDQIDPIRSEDPINDNDSISELSVPILEILTNETVPTINNNNILTNYKDQFEATISEIFTLDSIPNLNAGQRNKRANLVSKRNRIQDMIDSIISNIRASVSKQTTMNTARNTNSSKYTPDYPTFQKKGPKDIKSPLLFIRALEIALESSGLSKTLWIKGIP